MLTLSKWGSLTLPRFMQRLATTIARLLLLGLGVGLVGCQSIVREIQPPQVELVGLQFIGAELNRQSFQVTLDVTNPNPIPVPINAFSYQIALAGGAFADGNSVEKFTLPVNGTERVRLNVGTDLVGTLSRISNILKGPASVMDYEINGDLTVGLPLVEPIPFSQTGEIALKMQ